MPHTHKDPCNIDMIARLITAAGRHASHMDEDQLARLYALHDAVDLAMVTAIAGQRSCGITWASIGEAMGTTRQAALMRWGPAVADLTATA